MASRPDNELEHKPSETLRQNKRRMGSAKSKMQDIQENGNGREPKPSGGSGKGGNDRPAKTDSRGAKQLTGKESDFALIMGRDGKAVTSKVNIKDMVQRHVEGKGQGRSDMRPSNLHVPIARAQRLATEDGRTSFHFSHDSISKTHNAVVNDAGRVNRPGAAKAHNKYIERESAVAIDEDGQDIVPANDTGAEQEADVAINDNQPEDALSKEPYFDRPLSRSFLRAYRATLGALLADSDTAPGGIPTGPVHSLRDLPGGDLVRDGGAAEMLVFADEVPVVGRDGTGGTGLRRAGDGDRQDRGGSAGRLAPVPARLSRPAVPGVEKAVEALGGRPTAANDLRTPDGQGKYIERQEAMAIQPDGTRVLYTNIDNDAEKRAEFWRLVEEHEYDASPDKMTFTVSHNPAFWERVSKHAKCPEKLAAALAVADPTKALSVDTDDNVEMRRFLSSVEGWKDAGAKRPGEKPADYTARRREDVCKFQDGRGGRVQYRIIGELPHELSVKERASILKTFSEEFEKRKLPFVSVMHAPDHTNDDKNWHFHLVYYDRPCSRVTEEQVIENAQRRNDAGEVKHVKPDMTHVGQWDFSVSETYLRPGRYEKRTNYPYAQQKVKEVGRHQDWIEKLRKRLADITNDHLQEAGIERRLDPRRHSEMGIHSNPQEHLGTKLANLEAMGIATPIGVSNEERQWEAMQRKLDQDLERRKSVVDQQARKWLQQGARAPHLDDAAKAALRDNVTRWHQHRTEAEEHVAISENVTQHIERTTSRAKKVRETCQKQLAAIDAGNVTKFQASRAENLQIKSAQAIEWLATTTELLKDEYKLAQDCKRTAERESLVADQIELAIERALISPTIREVAAEASRTRVEEQKRKAENDQIDREVAAERDRVEKTEERRRALVKEEMDKWINDLLRTGRRLVRDGRRVVPVDMTPEDRSIADAINFNAMQSRLSGMKRKQDDLIADVVKAIGEEPANVIQQRTPDGPAYVLVTSNRKMAKAFTDYAAEPEIVQAREEALQANAAAAARRADERRIAAEARASEEAIMADRRPVRVEETAEPAPRTRTEERPAADRERAGAPGADAKPVAEKPRTPAPTEVDRAPAQPRVEPVAPMDERRARVAERQAISDRIARAVKDEARRVVVRDGVATISQRNLDAIGATAEDVSDKTLQKRLVSLANVQDREIKRLTAYARKYPGQLVERNGAMALSAKAPRDLIEISGRWRNEDSVDLALRSIREEARGGASRPSAPVERTPVAEPIRSPEETERRAPPAEPREPAPAPVAPKPERPRLTEVEPDMDLRAEAKAYAEQQARLREASQQSERAARTTREQRTGEDDLTRAVRIASEKAATAGAHPLIDQWIQSVQDGITAEERREIALRITNDRSAREKLRDIDRQLARRIRDEADQAREARQPGLGLDMGQTPKR